MDIRYTHGKPSQFVATRQFALGSTGITVSPGTPVNFDGTTAEVDGAKYVLPQLRGAVKADWLVLPESYNEGDPTYGQPVSANIQMRSARQTGNDLSPATRTAAVTVESDERIIGNSREMAAATRDHNANRKASLAKSQVIVHNQEGTVVRGGLKTASKQVTTLTPDTFGSALRAAETVKIEAGEGVTEDQMLAAMTEDQQVAYLSKKESLRSQYVTMDEPRVVGSVRRPGQVQTEGMLLTQSVGGGAQIYDPSGMGGKPVVTETEVEGIRMVNTNGPGTVRTAAVVDHTGRPLTQAPQRAAVATSSPAPTPKVSLPDNVRLAMAKAVCAEFPETYSFSEAPKKRIARLRLDYEDRPDILRAAFVAESQEMQALLAQEFPEAFVG